VCQLGKLAAILIAVEHRRTLIMVTAEQTREGTIERLTQMIEVVGSLV
jgi:hypothetical protein